MPIRANDPRPAYAQLADELRQAISAGDYQPGDKLPSTRELSESYGIALMTVRAGLKVLEDERLVVAEHGRGVFVRTPDLPGAEEPMEAVRARLAETMGMLRGISDRIGGGGGAESPGATNVVGIDADLAKVMDSLAVIDARLAAADAPQGGRPAGLDDGRRPPQPTRDVELDR